MKIVRVTDEARLRELFAFRYRIYVEELGWLEPCPPRRRPPSAAPADPEALAAGLLTDRFDPVALNYAAYEDGAVVGSIRVVPDSPAGLPLEQCRSLDGYRAGRRLVELCRLAVAPELRCTRLAPLLMKAGYQGGRLNGATHIVMDTYLDRSRRNEALYAKLGFEPLSDSYPDPAFAWDLPVLPLALDCAAAEAEWPETRPSLHRFFTSSDSLIDHGPGVAW